MTINELAQAAGVTTRTIRYYVEQGVLPPPTRGRPAEYTTEHTQRLELIRRLKEQYLPLEEIRDTMQRLSLAQVEELLAAHAPTQKAESDPAPPDSASDYITNVLGRGAAREQMKRQNVPPPSLPPTFLPPPAMPAYPAPAPPGTLPAPVLPGSPPGSPDPGGVPRPEWIAPNAPPSAPQRAVTPIIPWPPQLLEMATQNQAMDNIASTWQRIPLAPGIELHYQVSPDARINDMVDRLIDAAGRILAERPENRGEESP